MKLLSILPFTETRRKVTVSMTLKSFDRFRNFITWKGEDIRSGDTITLSDEENTKVIIKIRKDKAIKTK